MFIFNKEYFHLGWDCLLVLASQLFPVILSDNQLRYSNYIEMDYYIDPLLVSLASHLSAQNSPFSEFVYKVLSHGWAL